VVIDKFADDQANRFEDRAADEIGAATAAWDSWTHLAPVASYAHADRTQKIPDYRYNGPAARPSTPRRRQARCGDLPKREMDCVDCTIADPRPTSSGAAVDRAMTRAGFPGTSVAKERAVEICSRPPTPPGGSRAKIPRGVRAILPGQLSGHLAQRKAE